MGNWLFCRSEINKSRLQQFDNYAVEKLIGKRIAVIGSGPGMYGVDANILGDEAVNLCVWPQNFKYDYRLIEDYHTCLQIGFTLIHVISLLSFSENNYVYKTKFNLKYCNVLPHRKVDVASILYLGERYFPSILHPRDYIRFLRREGGMRGKRIITDLNENEKREKALGILEGWKTTNEHLNNFHDVTQLEQIQEAIEENIAYLKRLRLFCYDTGITYIPIIAPVCAEIRNGFSDEFLDGILYQPIKDSGCIDYIIDYLDDERFSNISLYYDGLFLNEVGSKLLTEDLKGHFKRYKLDD